MTPTHAQQTLIDAIGAVLEADPEIQAAWLGGSLGRGTGDTFSDVDIVALVQPPAGAGQVGLRHAREADRLAPAVLVNPLFGGRVLNVVTNDWRRFDIAFLEAGDLDRYDATRLVVLFNKGHLTPRERPATTYAPAPRTVLGLVNEFLRVLGLLVVAAGREEWVLALSGTEILRRLTLDLMLEENRVGPEDRGGALHRNPFLTADQRIALESLRPVSADRDALFAANVELAELFLPMARRLAGRVGAPWPEEFEAATRRHLSERLGLTFA